MLFASLLTGSTITTIFVIIAGAGGCSFVVAARIYKNLADGYKLERDLAVEKSDRLSSEVEELRQQIRRLEEQIQTLRLKDVSALFDLMQHHDDRMQEASRVNQESVRQTSRILERIATAVIPPD